MNEKDVSAASIKEPETIVQEHTENVNLCDIAITFLYIGLASFSLAALGEVKNWVTKQRGWFTDDEYLQGLALAQLMPGAPTVNLSSYLGYRLRGLPGAATATISFLIPCFLLMLILSYLYLNYGQMPIISGLFRGLGALVVGLVFNTILNLWKSGVKTIFNWIMALAGFALVFWLKIGIIKILLIASGSGIIMTILAHFFPILAVFTDPLGDFLKKNKSVSNQNDSKTQRSCEKKVGNLSGSDRQNKTSEEDVEFISACSRTIQTLRWQNTAKLILFLLIILGIDLALIRLRPELMQMGTSFLRIGALVFGSGYAMLPFIQDIVVNQFAWLTNQQFAVALALSLITPGPVTIIGAFIGYKVAGVIGALAGIMNMYFPAWAMTTVIASPYAKAGRIVSVKQIISGIVAAFIGTLIVVLIKLAGDTLVDISAITMAIMAFVVQRYVKINTVWIVLGGALVSLVLFH